MTNKRTHFPQTTASQRKLLFETWEETGNVSQACRTAHVGRGTFYYWKPRFDDQGYAGLTEFESRAPQEAARTGSEIEQKVIQLRREQPKWGQKRIAQELAKGNSWVAVISPNTVKRILQEAGLWRRVEQEVKKK